MSANAKSKQCLNNHSKVFPISTNNIPYCKQAKINGIKNNFSIKNIKETIIYIPKPKQQLINNTKKPLGNNNFKIQPVKLNLPLRKNNFSKINYKPITTRERSRSYQSNRRKEFKSTPQSLNNTNSPDINFKESTKDQTTNNNQCINLDIPIKEINVWNNITVNDPGLTLRELKEKSIKLKEDYDLISLQNSQSIKSTIEYTNKQLHDLKEHYKIISDNKHQLLFNSTNTPLLFENSTQQYNRNNYIKRDLQENINGISLGVFTRNYENYQINNNSKSISFTDKEYKQLLNTFSMIEYGSSIISDYFDNELKLDSVLERHEINPKMRMKMIDWMIEVFSSFKCSDETFFIAVQLMDRFFYSSPHNLLPNDLHLIGITCIFIASKFSDVYPIKLKVIIDKISHNKYELNDITQMEDTIMTCLDYNILLPTILDFLNFYFEDLFFFFENNFNITNSKLSEYLVSFIEKKKMSIKLDVLYFDKCAICKKFTDNLINFLYCTIMYLAKMCCHDYEINSEKPSLVAASVLLVGLRICEEVNCDNYVNELFLEKLAQVSRHNQYSILHLSQKVLFNAQNYEKVYCGMENLKLKHFYALAAIHNTK